jgi:transposase-like protein
LCAGKNGVSALELSRTLGIAYRSAWFMAHRIRYAMTQPPLVDKLRGVVESDETYVGGRMKRSQGAPMQNKIPVVTLVERDGAARSQVMKQVTGENIRTILEEQVDQSATLMTDERSIYQEVGKSFAGHETVNHSADEYVRGNAHINTTEGYFSQLKRSVDGTYHHVSAQHLHRYLAEFDYRYNSRKVKDGERTIEAIKKTAGKRLRYEWPTAKESETQQSG